VSAQHELNRGLAGLLRAGPQRGISHGGVQLRLRPQHLDLVGGMCQTDYSGYPDCRRVFVDSLQTTMSLALAPTCASTRRSCTSPRPRPGSWPTTWACSTSCATFPHRLQRRPYHLQRVGLRQTRQPGFGPAGQRLPGGQRKGLARGV
jgi:hypothetical protein